MNKTDALYALLDGTPIEASVFQIRSNGIPDFFENQEKTWHGLDSDKIAGLLGKHDPFTKPRLIKCLKKISEKIDNASGLMTKAARRCKKR